GAAQAYQKLKARIKQIVVSAEGKINQTMINEYKQKFKKALKDDLKTANALTVLFELLKDVRLNNITKKKLIADFDQVLSLSLITKGKKVDDDKLVTYINKKIAKREQAKEQGDYQLADSIRRELKEKGIILIDKKNRTDWEKED
ncbi:MAG: DALR domain-containing protein, partial [Bacilli bacterium]